MNCPCYNCVCVAMCRHKKFHILLNNCCILDTTLYNRGRQNRNKIRYQRLPGFNEMILEVRDSLRPTRWFVDTETGQSDHVVRNFSETGDPVEEMLDELPMP